ncbi:MAG: hypothetical protein JST88_09405 [Bacteroidetes bacterium]|nr:hypothetical protein [Bacteroidota bacterium]
MAQVRDFKPYSVAELPVAGIDVDGLYFVKGAGDVRFTMFVRNLSNSDWITLGTTDRVDTVNGLTGVVVLSLSLDGSGKLSITGNGATIDLDARYRKKSDQIPWAEVSGKPTTVSGYGITDAVRNAGDEGVAGVKTFSSSPVVPNASSGNQAVAKGQVDTAVAGLQTQINTLGATVSDQMKVPLDIDCSGNPNYPPSIKGDGWRVTVAGKVGGAGGVDVGIGALIVCKVNSPGGTQAAVGGSFYIVHADHDQATETVLGIIKVATLAQASAGADDTTAVTPKKLQSKIDAERATSNTRYVRTDIDSQGLDPTAKQNARTNINAADNSAVVHISGSETISGTKQFSSPVYVPTATEGTADGTAATTQFVQTAAVGVKTKWTRDW